MPIADERDLEIESLRERLSRLSEASLRINESLDLDRVLQGVLDSARALTGARYGVILLFDEHEQIQNFLTSGFTSDQAAQLWKTQDGKRIFEGIGGFSQAVRVKDLQSYVRELGFPEFQPPVHFSTPLPFLIAPITYLGKLTGVIYLAGKESGQEFTPEDEETIVMFASQSALVIVNARLYRDEQRARSDLEALVDTAPVGVVVFDAQTGVPVYVNRETRRISTELTSLDMTPEEVLGDLTVRRAGSEDVSLRELSLSTMLRDAEAVRAEEIVISVPDGESVTALINATPIRSQGGEVESFVITIQDMSPLEEMERLRTDFLATVSHELRAPLSSIKGSAATLAESWASLDPAELDQFFRIIEQEADRMSSLITDLLDVARIETGSFSISPAPVGVAVLIDEARNTYLTAGGSENIRIELPPDLPLVMADRRRMVQVIINLLSNAARYSPDSQLIRVTAEHQGVYVAISVSDQGRGIPADRLPHLFQKFSSSNDQRSDYGLGLAICKGIVDAHGGRIWAESRGPGLGATFTFILPIAEESHTEFQGVGSPRRGIVANRERGRILVVDDDPQTLRYVRGVLSESGYELSVAADPSDVPRLLSEQQPHLVLMDLMLPGTDGIELMKTVSELANVPVIFLSAYGQDEVIARAFETGAADYVVKPFSPTELVARINAALRKHGASSSAGVTGGRFTLRDLVVDYSQRQVTVSGSPVELTDTEYRVLFELTNNAGRIMTHEQLVRRVWGHNPSGGSAPARVIVMRLRSKLGDDAVNPRYIFTRRGVGYWMAESPEV